MYLLGSQKQVLPVYTAAHKSFMKLFLVGSLARTTKLHTFKVTEKNSEQKKSQISELFLAPLAWYTGIKWGAGGCKLSTKEVRQKTPPKIGTLSSKSTK